jgi:hypothetical protein
MSHSHENQSHWFSFEQKISTWHLFCCPGLFCEIDVAVCNSTGESRCMNGGICIEGPGESYTCSCLAGMLLKYLPTIFTNQQYICINSTVHTPKQILIILSGWTGDVCEMPTDECASSPCMNGGVCVDHHADYACACPFGEMLALRVDHIEGRSQLPYNLQVLNFKRCTVQTKINQVLKKISMIVSFTVLTKAVCSFPVLLMSATSNVHLILITEGPYLNQHLQCHFLPHVGIQLSKLLLIW